jgi:hypothetical protein
MKKNLLLPAIAAACFVLCVSAVSAQQTQKYSFAAQSKFIPKDLGRVYLGMPLKDFAKQIDLRDASIEDDRFRDLGINVPFEKGNIAKLTIGVGGFDMDLRETALRQETVKRKFEDGSGEYDATIKRLVINEIPSTAFVFSIEVTFKPDFDQKSFVVKAYGKGTVRDPDDEYHFSDIEWTKRTSDGLLWLIRSLHEGDSRSLRLIGRIKGTDWEID